MKMSAKYQKQISKNFDFYPNLTFKKVIIILEYQYATRPHLRRKKSRAKCNNHVEVLSLWFLEPTLDDTIQIAPFETKDACRARIRETESRSSPSFMSASLI